MAERRPRGRPPEDLPHLVRQLAQEAAYQLPCGEPNKSLIARETGVSRARVQAILRARTP